MNKDMPPTDAARRVALIRSVVAFAERRDLAEHCDGRHECHQHGRTFDPAYLWVRL